MDKKLECAFRFLQHYPITILAVIFKKDIQCRVPKSTIFSHGAIGIVITKNARLGNDVTIGQNVTIGKKKCDDVPVIEDHVVIFPHAIVFGNITIGHHSIVGAGAVVNKSFPPFSIVVGNPCKRIKKMKSIEEYEAYRDKRK